MVLEIDCISFVKDLKKQMCFKNELFFATIDTTLTTTYREIYKDAWNGCKKTSGSARCPRGPIS